jgi:GTP-binding protein
LLVPPGTVISQKNHNGTAEFIADLQRPGEEQFVARGGQGGAGNTHYATSTYQAPQIAQRGEKGENRKLLLEMRLIADAGIIGLPNAGKSTLLAAASAARPKIASYPFTTLEPVLGVVEVGIKSFVMADIPGLIEGAHRGRGLGHDFLRHIMRTRVLVHVLDASTGDPLRDMAGINEELDMFDPQLARKPQIVAVNKIDLPGVKEMLKDIGGELRGAGMKFNFVSAQTGQGVEALMAEVLTALERLAPETREAETAPRVFRPEPRGGRISVRREGERFIIEAPELERLMTRDGSVSNELRYQLKAQLRRMGAGKLLEKEGIKRGDRVRCGELEWEW